MIDLATYISTTESFVASFCQTYHLIEESLYRAEEAMLLTSYHYGRLIDEKRIGRIAALAIPIICLVSEIVKLISDSEKLLSMGVRSFIYFKLETGNARNTVVNLCEHGRNIYGIISGLFLGLYSPKIAKDAFLVPKEKEFTPCLSEVDAAQLYAVGYALHAFFQLYGIDYRICSGTVLGAERHQGLIPWDDDIDIMSHPDAWEKLNKLFEDGTFTKKTGMQIKWQPITGGWQCFHPDSPKGKGPLKGIGVPFVDVFRMKHSGDKIIYDSYCMNLLSSYDYFTEKEWSKPKECEFGPIKMIGVAEPLDYLTRCYGPDSLCFGYQTMPHDELSKICGQLLDVQGHLAKMQKYGFPRRALIVDRSAIQYDENCFKTYKELIDKILS